MENQTPKTEWNQIRNFAQNNEELALLRAAEKLGVPKEQLEACHDETCFRFKIKPEFLQNDTDGDQNTGDNTSSTDNQQPSTNNEGHHKVSKEYEVDNAYKIAMAHFDTFEGNIKREEAHETEDHYVFSKVR